MSYRPTPIKRESVITRAAQEICRYIADEKLKPGETLPTETHFSQLLGMQSGIQSVRRYGSSTASDW